MSSSFSDPTGLPRSADVLQPPSGGGLAAAAAPFTESWAGGTALQTQRSDRTFIRLSLSDGTLIAIATEFVQEVRVVAAQRLTVMPNMPRSVIGLLNHRSRVIWVADLSDIFALSPLDLRSSEYHLAILRAGGVSLGVAVNEVKGVIRLAVDRVESPLDHDLPEAMVPYLQGCVSQSGSLPASSSPASLSAQPSVQLSAPSSAPSPLLIVDAEAIASYGKAVG